MAATILITCGPASEPIDQVRRITNFSTGELGVCLAEKAAAAGFRVICCKGAAATWPHPAAPCETRLFGSNADLLRLLEPIEEPILAIFHAAALSDFQVSEIEDGAGRKLIDGKIPSATSEVRLRLVPAPKILPRLRQFFPAARIIGWKYEVDGTRAEALDRGRQQIRENQTNGCVINGAAYGTGFGVLIHEKLLHCPDKNSLGDFLVGNLQN